MSKSYARDLDLNLLRVFVVVAETGSVTAAAARLYLTQPAISAALKRLSSTIGVPLFAREGRGIALTTRGRQLLASARPHLAALVDAAQSPPAFAPAVSDRTIRLGLSDTNESWLLPRLMHALSHEAPYMRVIALPVQFRTVGQAFASGSIDLAVTVADELPAGTARRTLFTGGFTCLFDPRHARVGKKLTRARYLAHDHVVVSYNGDLRGIVEDLLRVNRRVRVSVPSFNSVGAIVEGSALLATVPSLVAREITKLRSKLRVTPLPFVLPGGAMEIMWRTTLDDDPAMRFVMEHVARIARTQAS